MQKIGAAPTSKPGDRPVKAITVQSVKIEKKSVAARPGASPAGFNAGFHHGMRVKATASCFMCTDVLMLLMGLLM